MLHPVAPNHRSSTTYQRRRPEESVLHPCIMRHWPLVRDRFEAMDRPLPPFVEREFESYLRCGALEYGFARIHCPGCGHERLVAFSCKGRGFCPSCGGRRMHEGAAYLCNRILPEVPLRQWVLTFPKVLRYLLAYDGKLCRAASHAATLEIFRFQRLQARRQLGLPTARCAHPGALVAVQRFGSALNLNVHFHSLLLDGVYVLDAFGLPTFMALPQPTLAELDQVARRIAQAILVLLRRWRIWLDFTDEDEDPVAQRSSGLAGLARASLMGTLVFGAAGARPVRFQDAPVREMLQVERSGKALGFSLDAEVRVSAHKRLHRERLCRYLLRPPLAKGRLHETMDGKYAFELKTPWSDGTRVIFFSGEELVARLTALVPPPRMHLVHYYGVLAPNAKLRPLVVPEAPDEEESLRGGACCCEEERKGQSVRRRWVPWAELLLKVFGVDVFCCPKCEGRMQRIAFITQPRVISAILECVGLKEEPP